LVKYIPKWSEIIKTFLGAPMTIPQKLERLLADMNRSAVARRAGVAVGVLWKITALKRTPRADVAARLARALGVDAGWLIDDTRGWPPVRIRSTHSSVA
jgi:transcriptional regulator with XRE-family HTH domain